MAQTSEVMVTGSAAKAIRDTLASFVSVEPCAAVAGENRPKAIDLEMALLVKLGKLRLS